MEQEMKSKKLQVTILLEKNEAFAFTTAVTIENISYYPNIGEAINFWYILGTKELQTIYGALSDLAKERLNIFHQNRPDNDHLNQRLKIKGLEDENKRRELLLSLALWGPSVSSCKVTEKILHLGNETDILYYRVACLDKI